jgi:hypothetical protein
MKCANCNEQASYEYRVTQEKSLFYCGKDLPKFLDERKRAGLLKITPQLTEDLKSALDILGTPSPEAVSETPKPKKKTVKKTDV